jgi:hypothetical protein
MADLTHSKSLLGSVAAEGVTDAVENRLETLITPEKLRTSHLFGLPLISGTPDPMTGKAMVYTDPLLVDTISEVIATLETELGIYISPVQKKEKHAFDKSLYDSFMFFKLKAKPCSAIQSITITPPGDPTNPDLDNDVFSIPLEWVETANLLAGQVNVVPLTAVTASGGALLSGGGGTRGGAYLHMLRYTNWIPAWWKITYTAGFVDFALPPILNKLIGMEAAITVCSRLAATFAGVNSHSLGLDGVSQSVSGPGGARYKERMEQLEEKKAKLVGKVKAKFGTKFTVDNI